MKVFVVLPFFNEAAALSQLLSRLRDVADREKLAIQIIAVDDGSTDESRDIVREYSKQIGITELAHHANLGLGETLYDGLARAAEAAEGDDIIITMDADNTQPPELIPLLVARMQQGFEIVIASRYCQGSHVRGLTLFRRMMTLGARLLFQAAFRVPNVRDYTSGFRAYRARVIQQVLSIYGRGLVSERGFASMAEVLLKCHIAGARITEAPMVLRYDLKGGPSKMNVAATIGRLLLLVTRRLRPGPERASTLAFPRQSKPPR